MKKLINEFKYWWHNHGVWVISVVTVLTMAFLAGISESYSQEKRKYNIERFDRQIEVTCGPTIDIYTLLEKEYGEVPAAMALNDRQEAMVWFTNKERTTLTLVLDYPQGVSCMMFSGECSTGECYIPNAGSVM